MDFFKIFVVIAPFISAGLASFLTYVFGTRAKRKEYLYQNRIESFKQIAIKISELKKYCLSKVACYEGNEFSPFYDLEGSGLMHRSSISDTVEFNQIFLTNKSQKALTDLMNQLSFICNVELSIASGNDDLNNSSVYEATLKQADICLTVIYKELGIN